MRTLLDETCSLAEQLRLQKDRLVQAEKLAALGQIAAGIAHEINNPLAFVRSNCTRLTEYLTGLSEVVASAVDLVGLPEEAPPSRLRAAIDRLRTRIAEADADFAVQDACQLLGENSEGFARIGTIVDGMRGYERQDAERPVRTSIPDVIEGALLLTRNRVNTSCDIVLDVEDGLPEVAWYPRQIEQMLSNLIANAGRATLDQGTITISAHRHDSDRVRLTIRDDGTGIAPEIRNRLFDPFFTTRDVGQGMGLGLHIVHSIVERHGGEIQVDSRPGAGTSFLILLPIELGAESTR